MGKPLAGSKQSMSWRQVCLALLLGIVLLFLIGPCVDIDKTIRPVDLPENLDAFLVDREQRFDDLIPNTEKTIIWAGQPGAQTEYSLVYIHGFSATRQETAPLSNLIAQKLKANLFYTRLAGHGRTGNALAEASVNNWLNDTIEAFEIGKRIGKKVIMIGTSTGGTSVTWLAGQAGKNTGFDSLSACILISPNFKPADPSAVILTWPWGRQMAELVIGEERSWKATNPDHGRYWTNQYPTKALLPMMGLVKMVRQQDLSLIKTPCLVIYSPLDQVVDPQATETAFAAVGSERKTLVPVTTSQDPSHHVLAGNILSPGSTVPLADMIYKFIMTD